MQHLIVIGASSSIAQAIIQLSLTNSDRVTALSRQPNPEHQPNVDWRQVEYTDQGITQACEALLDDGLAIDRVLMFHGLLHNDDVFPEKQIRELSRLSLSTLFEANAITPMLWLQGLTPLLKKQKTPVVISVCSARVGSIGDNQLGGWYGYRASKAALNMLLKTTAIEFKRVLPHAKLMAFHPGTTNTPLSEPFQKGVPEGKLFTPEFVAEQLSAICDELVLDGELAYLDWAGEPINW